jgi:membrane associated rhomboid family serine protease
MTSTPVGMRCPECSRQRTQVKNPIAMPTGGDAPATYTLIAMCVAAYVAQLAGGGGFGSEGSSVLTDGGLFAWGLNEMRESVGVAGGEPYRLITSAFLHAGVLHLAFNMFALYILGTVLEPGIGTARFLGIYVVSVLAGSAGALALDPNELTVGASGGIFGLMAATFLIARSRGMDELASQIGLFVVLNLVITVSVPRISIGGHLGGLIGGALAAFLVSRLERARLSNAREIEIGGLVGLALAAAIIGYVLAEAEVPPGF